jgi:hypothetical protein
MESNRLPRAEINFARNGGVAIAFQMVGDGDVNLVYVPDFASNLVSMGGSIRRGATSTSVSLVRSGATLRRGCVSDRRRLSGMSQ